MYTETNGEVAGVGEDRDCFRQLGWGGALSNEKSVYLTPICALDNYYLLKVV
jgi:hypothetical protein